MAITRPCYCSREDVKQAMDIKSTAWANDQIDRAITAASDAIDSALNRQFYPETATRYKDWPNFQYTYPWRVWLERDEVISVTTLVAGGVTISSNNYFLEPANLGPPYDRIELNRSSSVTFGSGATPQRAIAITGVFGFSADTAPAGTLAAQMSDTTGTTITVSDSGAAGVGDLIIIGTERMLVTGKTMVDTAIAFSGLASASSADRVLAVASGPAFAVGEVLQFDSERCLVVSITGNNLTLLRAWDGTVLAAHTSGTIYAARQFTVTRGALGSTAATHLNAAVISKSVAPPLIRELAVAEAINFLASESSGWARTVGEGESVRNATGAGLAGLRAQAASAYGRQLRLRAV